MADFKGSILELNGKKAIVMTDNCDFVTVKRQQDMAIGQERRFNNLDLYKAKKNYIKYMALAASVCLVLLSYFMFSQVYMPGTVFAYVDIDINPSIELTVNKNIQVIDAKPLNEDAKTLLEELKLKKLPLKQAVTEVINESEKLGYIKTDKGNAILVSSALAKEDNKGSDKEKALDSVLDDIDKVTVDFDNKKIETEVVKVTSENREEAVKNNISMGRYALYNKIKQDDEALTIDEAKVSRVYDMLEKLHKLDNKGNKDNKDDEIKQVKPDTNIENNNSADKGNNQSNKADKYKEDKEDKQNQGNSGNTGGNNNTGPKDNPGAAKGDTNPGKGKNDKSEKTDTGQNASDNKGLADKNVKPAEAIDGVGQPSSSADGDKSKNGTGQSTENGNNDKDSKNVKENKGIDASGSQNDKGNSNDNGKNNKK